MLEGKVRPQPQRNARPEKALLEGKSDVKLREKQKDFELRDYQAQRVRNLPKTYEQRLGLPPVAYTGYFNSNFTTQSIDCCIKNAKFLIWED